VLAARPRFLDNACLHYWRSAPPIRWPGSRSTLTKNKKRALIVVGILISVGFLWFALRGTDFAQISHALANSSPWMVLPMLAAYAIYYWIKAVRWRLMLLPVKDATTRSLVRPMMIGFFGNNVLPAHLGEFVRMYLGARQLGLRNSEVLATIVLERMFDFLAVVFFLGVALVLSRDVPEGLVTIGYVTGIVGIVFMIFASLYVAMTPAFLAAVRRLTFFLPAKVRNAGLHQLELGATGLQSLRRLPLLLGVIVTSIAQWGFMGLTIYVSLRAVGSDVRIAPAFVVLAATTFGVTLPSAPGFLGTVQAGYVLALEPFGVSRAEAFAASAFFHLPTFAAVTLLGLWLLRGEGNRVADLQREAESAAATETARAEHKAPGQTG